MSAAAKKLTTNPILAERLVVIEGAKWPLFIDIVPRQRPQNNPRFHEPAWCQEFDRGWAE